MKTFILRSLLGIFFGSFLAVLMTFAVIYFGNNEILNSELFVQHTLRSMFAGWFFTVTPLIFENKNLSLFQQTAIHFATVIILYFALAFGTGWIPYSPMNMLLILVLFIAAYITIWSGFYLYYKKQAERLNEELDNL